MAFEIIKKLNISETVISIDVHAPQIARKQQPGQFVLLRINETGERIPLTIADADTSSGTIKLIFQVVGKTTALLQSLSAGDEIKDILGPLGTPSHMDNFGLVVGVGGGIGVAALYPVVRALKEKRNRVINIIGAQRADLLILENDMRNVSDEFFVTTDDGSKGHHGRVTDILGKILDSGDPVGLVTAVGPVPMMQAVSDLTRPRGVKTMVSLNTIMIDGTGMCGGCRVNVGDKNQFTCVDGPEFDGHRVDFKNLSQRLRPYKEAESCALKSHIESHSHNPAR